jgi:hypothetical protein
MGVVLLFLLGCLYDHGVLKLPEQITKTSYDEKELLLCCIAAMAANKLQNLNRRAGIQT